MKKIVGRIVGIVCGIGFVVLLTIAVVQAVRHDSAFNYGAAALVLALMALGAERLTK